VILVLTALVSIQASAQMDIAHCAPRTQQQARWLGNAIKVVLDFVKSQPTEETRLKDLHKNINDLVEAKKRVIVVLDNCGTTTVCTQKSWDEAAQAVRAQLKALQDNLDAIGEEMKQASLEKQQDLTSLHQAVDAKMLHLQCFVPDPMSESAKAGLSSIANKLKCDVRNIEEANCKLVKDKDNATKSKCDLSYDEKVCQTGSKLQ
jgi:hypothetical protein